LIDVEVFFFVVRTFLGADLWQGPHVLDKHLDDLPLSRRERPQNPPGILELLRLAVHRSVNALHPIREGFRPFSAPANFVARCRLCLRFRLWHVRCLLSLDVKVFSSARSVRQARAWLVRSPAARH
jgi:hypothetical protein